MGNVREILQHKTIHHIFTLCKFACHIFLVLVLALARYLWGFGLFHLPFYYIILTNPWRWQKSGFVGTISQQDWCSYLFHYGLKSSINCHWMLLTALLVLIPINVLNPLKVFFVWLQIAENIWSVSCSSTFMVAKWFSGLISETIPHVHK